MTELAKTLVCMMICSIVVAPLIAVASGYGPVTQQQMTQVIPAGSVIRTPIGQIILVRVDSLLVEPEYPRPPIIVPEPRRPEYPRPEPPRPPHQPTPTHQPESPHQPNQPGHPHK